MAVDGGGRYSYRDEEGLYDITTAAQYLYSGTHQAAALLSWNNLLKSKLSAAGMWIGSFPIGQASSISASVCPA